MRPSARAAALACTTLVSTMLLSTLLLTTMLAALLVIAPAARAETAYRYWTYWSVTDGAWRFSTIGPASAIPADGAVEGWRFAVTTAAGSAGDAPDIDAATAFESICGSTPPATDMKRIAISVDFGMPEDAPVGERSPVDIKQCVTAEESATGYEMLRSIADVRVGDGLVCGIESYPLVECAEPIEERAPTATGIVPVPESILAASESSSPAAPLITGVALLIAATIGTLAWRRRDRG